MTHHVYERGLGGYTFTAAEIDAISLILEQQTIAIQTNPSGIGLGGPIYATIYQYITTLDIYGNEIPKGGVEFNVWLWIKGAADVNSDVGFNAAFIREYTVAQFKLRGGDAAAALATAQIASNDIALNLAIDIVTKGNLPGIGGLGAIDAGAAASKVFANLDTFGVEGDYAGWAGTLLFPYLNSGTGSTNFFEDWLLSAEAVTGTMPKADGTGVETKTVKHTPGTYDLVAAINSSRIAAEAAAFASKRNFMTAIFTGLLGPRLMSSVPSPDQAALMNAANEFFWNYYGLQATDGFRPGDGLPYANMSSMFFQSFVGAQGDDTLDTKGAVGAILNAGAGDDTIIADAFNLLDGAAGIDSVEYRDYLPGLKIELTTLLDQSSNIKYRFKIDSKQVGDQRNGFAYEIENFTFGSGDDVLSLKDVDFSNLSGLVRVDLGRNTTAAGDVLDANQLGTAIRVVGSGNFYSIMAIGGTGGFSLFGAEGIKGSTLGDYLQGNDLDNFIAGGDGADTLNGGAGDDVLEGGAGNDSYHFNGAWGADIISDATGDGSIFIDGVQLQGGIKVAANVWEDIAQGITYSLVGDSQNPTLIVQRSSDSNVIMVRGWQMGQLGLTMQDQPTVDPARVYNGDQRPGYVPGSTTYDWGATSWQADSTLAGGVAEANFNDVIVGSAGNDQINGFGGNDALDGNEGDDLIIGGEGNDLIAGGQGADTIRAGAGNDYIISARSWQSRQRISASDHWSAFVSIPNNASVWTSGSTWMIYGYPNGSTLLVNPWDTSAPNVPMVMDTQGDVVDAGSGDDIVVGGYGLDVINGGDGDDDLWGSGAGDLIWGDAGNDYIDGDGFVGTSRDYNNLPDSLHGNDFLDGGAGNDSVVGGGGNDTILGGADADSLFGDNWQNPLSGEKHGSDFIDGGAGADLIVGGGKDDSLYGGLGDDELQGDAPTNTLAGAYHGHDLLDGGAGNDLLIGYGGNDTLIGGADNDVLEGDGTAVDIAIEFHGDDLLDGGDGNDTLYGGGGQDTLEGGGGADSLYGQGGHDLLSGGDGNDRLAGDEGNDVLQGGAGHDALYGDAGNDTLDGGAGNDTLFGGAGADVYVFGIGSGRDTIVNTDNDAQGSAPDSLRIGANASGVTLTRSSDHLVVSIAGTSDRLEVQNFFALEGASSNALESLQFADGTVWDLSAVKAQMLVGYFDHDSITGYSTHDWLSGGAGYDTLNGLGGNDVVDGGAGYDELYGGDGDDTLYGMSGNDLINGGNGNDIVNGGIGVDTVNGGSGNDVLRGDAGDDNLVGWDGNDTLDGGIGNDHLAGGEGADTFLFNVGSGRDWVQDLSADDRLIFGPGITPQAVTAWRSTSAYTPFDLLISLNGSADLVVVQDYFRSDIDPSVQVGLIEFADGTIWNQSITQSNLSPAPSDLGLQGTGAADALNGGLGADILRGADGNDTLDGGAGSDTLEGGLGDDTYLFGKGSGSDLIQAYSPQDTQGNDVVQLRTGVATSDVSLKRYGADLELHLPDTGDVLLIRNYFADNAIVGEPAEVIRFADGTTWNTVTVAALVQATSDEPDRIVATEGADAINGLAGGDVVFGGGGNDTLDGDHGNDELYGDAGDDALRGGIGNDWLYGGSGNDRLEGGDGHDRLFGDAGDDTLIGGAGAELLDGGAGNDYLDGGEGDDTYSFGRYSGQDTIAPDVPELYAGLDEVLLDAGISPSGVAFVRDGDALEVFITGTGARLRVSSYFSTSPNIRFTSGGTVWNRSSVEARIVAQTASGGMDTLNGTADADVMNGLGGNDLVVGLGGNDTLDGGAGDDTLDGGAGNDYLFGGAGNDTYRFGVGDGQDWIYASSDSQPGRLETLEFKPGINPANLVLTVSGTLLVVAIAGSSDRVVIEDFFRDGDPANSFNPIQQFRFADGTIWDLAAIQAKLLEGTEGADTITGTSGADRIFGLGGWDILSGKGGNDTIDGGSGYDSVDGGDGNDALFGGEGRDTLYGGAGDDTLNGGPDDDVIDAGPGNDTYMFGLGDGTDWIGGNDLTSVHFGTLQFKPDVAPTDVTFGTYLDSDDILEIKVAESSDRVRVLNYFSLDYNPLQQIKFADGTIWDGAAIRSRLFGGTAGADRVAGASDNDSILGLGGADTLRGNGGNDTLEGGAGNDSLSGGDDNDLLMGGADNDYLSGEAGNDTLDGGSGTDTMVGGTGNDIYVVDATSDVVTEGTNAGADSVQSSVTYALGTNVENLTLTGSGSINGTGNALGNVILGNSANNVLSGGAGSDTMAGGAGNDTYVVDAAGDVVTELAGGGIDLVQSSIAYVLGAELENLTLTGTAAINGTGNAIANILTGNSGANILDGGAGSDTMIGGGGNDTYIVDATGDIVTEAASGGTDLVQASVSYTLGTEVENLTLTGTADINATGNTLANRLTGNFGSNVLNGGGGNDTMVGGAGDDTYYVDSTTDVVTELAGEGNDTVLSTISYTLGNNVENLRINATGALNATGNAADNILYAGAGNNVLNGLGGTDTASYVYATAAVTVNLASTTAQATGGSGSDTLQNIENLTGSGFNDTLTGNSSANLIQGGAGNDTITAAAGNDTLDGGAGSDSLVGGTGNDTYLLARGWGSDVISENDSTSGNTDVALFGADIATDQLWFRQVNSNLEVSVIGTSDKFTINNWYTGSQYRVERFRTADGKVLMDSQVQNLVQAMSAFSPPAAGQTTMPANYQSSLNPVIAANWS